MVGAGFSKNAGDDFPDWNELGDLFYQEAHGGKPDPVKQKYLNVLRLAEEVESASDRPALEELLRSTIPDRNSEPSSLHVELLELPWTDVFTTNYDTLLERASAQVVTRRYEPVVNKENIPYATKPRIVKLHGRFSSERHFIITEEDYRRYPHDYAPFVNTVQQALLENTFCLIGFSGDDPNFLQWIGWIRDNLGKEETQKIYLVGVFDLSSAKRKLLKERRIVVVDLSCCQGVENNDQKKALSWFFEYIRSKKPNVLDWPLNSNKQRPAANADRLEEIQEITEEWREQRQSYPGWLILPHDNREKLWEFTNAWAKYLPDTEQSPLGLDIQYAFELIWRLERCLLPVFNNIAEFCEKLLEKYGPFQTANPPANCQNSPGKDEFRDLKWDGHRQAWLAIALAMLRFYREEGYLDKWKEAENRLKTLSDHLSPEQREFLNYEGFLFSLFTLDLPNARQRLENWRPDEAQPYWMVKRAAGLAEIGLLNEAETIARDALENVRKKLNQKKAGTTDHLTLVSLESNAMLLGKYIPMLLGKYIQDVADSKKGEWETLQDRRMQFNDRWDELKRFKCDPGNEIKLFELTLKNPPVQRKITTEKREFDIGRVTRTHHFSSTNQEILHAYTFLRFCEEIGLPYHVGNYAMGRETAVESLRRISRYSSFWAIATLSRLGDVNAVNNLFSRESVYRFTANEADQLIQCYLDALDKCRDDIRAGDVSRNKNYGVRLAQLLPEVMSRLCCKCSGEMKYRILEFVTGIYRSPDKTKYLNIKKLTERLIDSMSKEEQYSLVPDLLEIPFPENLNPIVRNEFPNPFLLLELNQKPECATDLEIQPGLVNHLFRQAAQDNSDRRRWAIKSLIKLHKLRLLNDDQNKNLARAIWRVTDQHGLPDGDPDSFKFVFLSLPYPEDVDPSHLFKNYVSAMPFPIQKHEQSNGLIITNGNIPIVSEIIGANSNGGSIWTTEDSIEILRRLLEWWDADKDRLNEEESVPALFSSMPEEEKEFRARFARMVKLLAEVVGPKLSADSHDDIKTSLGRLLKEMRGYGLPCLEAEAACIHIYPEQKIDVYNRINEALISNQDNIELDGLLAIASIILNGIDTDAGSVESDPVSMFSQYITWRPTHPRCLSLALRIIVCILKESAIRFSTGLEVATRRRLDRLFVETAYDNGNPDLNFDEKLKVRHISSILAAALWTYYRSRSLAFPEAVEKWRETCLSTDEFSEIRNAWGSVKDKYQ